MPTLAPPQDFTELQQRAQQLAGKSLGELADLLSIQVPSSLLRAKGWVGQLFELFLGANAGSQAKPDFQHLGIELKSLPLTKQRRPQESTYVCTVPLSSKAATSWHDSIVYQKLRHVLWVPVQADPDYPVASRRIGTPLFWQPSVAEERQLRADWEELTEHLLYGEIEKIKASQGMYLHVRPKAMHAKALSWTINAAGDSVETLPRGFYLRTQFTHYLLQRYWR